MDRFQYLGLMLGCLALTLPLEFALGARVWRRPGRALRAIAPAYTLFVTWDLWAVHRDTWGFADRYTIGLRLPGGMVIEELVFFFVVPMCALLTFEAVRTMSARPGRRDALQNADRQPATSR
jgi:lycopene cyclase domain-containing protein